MKQSTIVPCVILGIALSASLVSCATSDTFNEATSVTLPTEGVELFGAPMDESVRLIGSDNAGHTFYVGQWEIEETPSYCLVMEAEESFQRACGETLPITAKFGPVRAKLDPTASQHKLSDEQILVGDYLIVDGK
ncbi:MAG: hypothetical protein ACTH8F_07480 [Microbacterium sp.]|uniref:hypothetical protein n=1 Tax=Microbacterium sp. TaxID=51671 RepID=UPI003F9860C4